MAVWAMCLTRYDGWFLIPFAALWFAGYAQHGKIRLALIVGLAGSLAPVCWAAHSWWLTGNALDFYNGPYSALAIQGGKPYPADLPPEPACPWGGWSVCSRPAPGSPTPRAARPGFVTGSGWG